MADDLSFRAPEGSRAGRRDPTPMIAVLLLLLGVLALTRPWWGGSLPEGVVIEVRGDVPRPGHHLVEPPTVEAALRAAGVAEPPADARLVPAGHQVRFASGRASLREPSDPLLVGLPIDVDLAEAYALQAIPGIGSATASRIVADRARRGPFRSVDDLQRVPGVSAATVEAMRPFVVANGSPLVDVNTASAPRLELLPGIGPVLAERIVAHREAHGPFSSIRALTEVPGVRSRVVEQLRDAAEASP
ncbi:MAG: helix-hairpin-helix domain-containing protein [Myxococcota bacterium]